MTTPSLAEQLAVAVKALAEAVAADANDETLDPLTADVERLTKAIESASPEPAQPGDTDPDRAITQEKTTMTGPAIHSKQTREFSVSKLIQGIADPTFKDWGYEREMSQETALKSGKDSSTVMLPWDVVTKATVPQDSVTAPSGTPATDPGQSLARPANDNSLLTITAGAAFLPTLGGALGVNQHFADAGKFFAPRLVGNVTPDWVARDADVSKTNALFDAVPATPHTLGATVEVRRSALIDCRPAMDAFLLQQLRDATVSALDDALIGKVSGASADAPAGLLAQIADGGALTDFASVQKLLRAVEYKIGRRPAIAFGPFVRDYLDSNPTGTGLTVPAGMLMPEGAIVSSKLDLVDPTKAFVLAGDFSYVHEVLFGGGIELAVNPYADSIYSKGGILLRVLVDADILVTDAARMTRGTMTVK